MSDVERMYEENVGKPPVTRYPDDHPDAWEWKYSGRPEERDRLRLMLVPDIPSEDQESLF